MGHATRVYMAVVRVEHRGLIERNVQQGIESASLHQRHKVQIQAQTLSLRVLDTKKIYLLVGGRQIQAPRAVHAACGALDPLKFPV